MKICVINGVNLNMLGCREEEHYGNLTLDEINKKILDSAKEIEFEFSQSNIEGEIVNILQSTTADAIIINAGAYTHYSYAIADALKCKKCVKIEVHMSNIHAREDFRHKSVIASSCDGSICGLGEYSYILAVHYCKQKLQIERK